MQVISEALQEHLDGEVTSLATCWKITRGDSVVLGFTDAGGDLVIESVTYRAATGFTPSASQSSAGLSVDNMEVEGMLDDVAILEADVLAGKYDFAEVEIFQVNRLDVAAGKLVLRVGTLGEVKLLDGRFVAEIRGLSQRLSQTIGQLFSPLCRARFCDAQCKLSLASYTYAVSVTDAESRQSFVAAGLTQDGGFFDQGVVSFSGGLNAGREMEVKAHLSGGRITLALPMPEDVENGDAFSVVAGCDKTFRTCVERYGNAVNFRGEPHVPGLDRLLETAATRSDW